jgi:hypothetical protein
VKPLAHAIGVVQRIPACLPRHGRGRVRRALAALRSVGRHVGAALDAGAVQRECGTALAGAVESAKARAHDALRAPACTPAQAHPV